MKVLGFQLKRLDRMYYRSGGETYPLYEATPGHPVEKALSKAIQSGEAKIIGEYYQYGMFGIDVAIALIEWKGKRFALAQEIKYEQSV